MRGEKQVCLFFFGTIFLRALQTGPLSPIPVSYTHLDVYKRQILGTPTAAAPKWLMDKYEGMYNVDGYGRTRGFGSRRHYCYNSPDYQKAARRIVAALGLSLIHI